MPSAILPPRALPLWSRAVLFAGWALAGGAGAGCASYGSAASGARLQRIRASPEYRDGHFANPEPTTTLTGGLGRVLREMLFGNSEMREPICSLPLDRSTATKLRKPPASGLRVTWLGHSTTLIELDGVTVLTDPIWSERASPFPGIGPRRFHPPPLALEELPRIDAVLISHDHYDHLDMATVQALGKRGAVFHVGLGVGAHLEGWGIAAAQIVEHEWWQGELLPGGVRLVATPARHDSGRWLGGNGATLWSSWALIGPQHRVYFSGDGGPSQGFEKVGAALGPFDLALIEIGQWNPSWDQVHLGPIHALDAFQALRARQLLPIHWATFELALHAWSEPAETLAIEAERRNVSLLTPLLGEPVEPAPDAAQTRWWRALPPSVFHCPPGSALPHPSFDHWAL